MCMPRGLCGLMWCNTLGSLTPCTCNGTCKRRCNTLQLTATVHAKDASVCAIADYHCALARNTCAVMISL